MGVFPFSGPIFQLLMLMQCQNAHQIIITVGLVFRFFSWFLADLAAWRLLSAFQHKLDKVDFHARKFSLKNFSFAIIDSKSLQLSICECQDETRRDARREIQDARCREPEINATPDLDLDFFMLVLFLNLYVFVFFQVFCSTFCSSRHADADTDADLDVAVPVAHGKSASETSSADNQHHLPSRQIWRMENPFQRSQRNTPEKCKNPF